MIEIAMQQRERFDRLMLFTNCTVKLSPRLIDVVKKYRDKLFLQVSQYHHYPEREAEVYQTIQESGINHRVRKYYGEDQSFGGWVDFGSWERRERSEEELGRIFSECAVKRVLHGNWRTRDGKVHYCSRSQRGMELGLMPDKSDDYVDLFDEGESIEAKREKFRSIADKKFIAACRHCSGDQGTSDMKKRFSAGEQER